MSVISYPHPSASPRAANSEAARNRGRFSHRGLPRAVNNLTVQALVAAFAAKKSIDEPSTRTAVTEVTTDRRPGRQHDHKPPPVSDRRGSPLPASHPKRQ